MSAYFCITLQILSTFSKYLKISISIEFMKISRLIDFFTIRSFSMSIHFSIIFCLNHPKSAFEFRCLHSSGTWYPIADYRTVHRFNFPNTVLQLLYTTTTNQSLFHHTWYIHNPFNFNWHQIFSWIQICGCVSERSAQRVNNFPMADMSPSRSSMKERKLDAPVRYLYAIFIFSSIFLFG